MRNIEVRIPTDYQNIIKKYPGINWSEIAEKAIIESALKLELMEKITSKSKLKEKDVETLDNVIKKSILKRYREK